MWSDVTHALSASNVAWVVTVAVRVCPSDLCMVYAHVTLSLRWPSGPPRGEAPTRRTLLYGAGWRFGGIQHAVRNQVSTNPEISRSPCLAAWDHP